MNFKTARILFTMIYFVVIVVLLFFTSFSEVKYGFIYLIIPYWLICYLIYLVTKKRNKD